MKRRTVSRVVAELPRDRLSKIRLEWGTIKGLNSISRSRKTQTSTPRGSLALVVFGS